MKKITLLLLATTTVAFTMDNPDELNAFETGIPQVAQLHSEILPESTIEGEDEDKSETSKAKLAEPFQETTPNTTPEQKSKSKAEKIKEYLSTKNVKYASCVIIPLGSYYLYKDAINKLAVSTVSYLVSKISRKTSPDANHFEANKK